MVQEKEVFFPGFVAADVICTLFLLKPRKRNRLIILRAVTHAHTHKGKRGLASLTIAATSANTDYREKRPFLVCSQVVRTN